MESLSGVDGFRFFANYVFDTHKNGDWFRRIADLESNKHWQVMTSDDKDRLKDLMRDLYQLDGSEHLIGERLSPCDDEVTRQRKKIGDAIAEHRWWDLLDHVRYSYITDRAYYRYLAWSWLGYPDIANAFRELFRDQTLDKHYEG